MLAGIAIGGLAVVFIIIIVSITVVKRKKANKARMDVAVKKTGSINKGPALSVAKMDEKKGGGREARVQSNVAIGKSV